jgi:hypothetical protein
MYVSNNNKLLYFRSPAGVSSHADRSHADCCQWPSRSRRDRIDSDGSQKSADTSPVVSMENPIPDA